MNRHALVLVLLISILTSCVQEDPITSLKVLMGKDKVEALTIFNIADDISFVLDGEADSIDFDLKNETILDFNIGWSHSYIHVKPGDRLIIDTISSSPLVFGVVGKSSKENEYLRLFEKEKLDQMEDYVISDATKLPVDSFTMTLEQKNLELSNLVKEIKADSEVSDYFKNAMELRLAGSITNDLSYYKGFYHRHYEKDPELPEDYYALYNSHDVSNPAYLLFEEGRRAASFYHSRNLDYQEYGTLVDFYKASIDGAKKLYGDSEVAKYCNLELLSNMINFGGGLDGATDMIDDFRAFSSNKYLNGKLDKTVEPWKDLVAGKSAPDFKAVTRDGKQVQLSELKGKKVYVDVWATWCGPCIAEIPALKKLEEELHEENIEFVSVSIDEEKDKDKWKTFIKDRELTGLQWMADGAWKSDVATSYNIKGIPRFMLIDPEGNILSANAPRPSSDVIKETLLN